MNWRWLVWLLVIVPLAVVGVLLPDPLWRSVLVNLAATVGLITTAASCWLRGRRIPAEARAWRWMSAALLLLSVRFGVPVVTSLAYGAPVPQWALLLHIPSNLMITVALLAMPLAPLTRVERMRTAAEGVLFAVGLLCLQWIVGVEGLPGFIALPTSERVMAVAPFFMNTINMGVILFMAAARPGRYLGGLGLLMLSALVASGVNLVITSRLLTGAHHGVTSIRAITLLSILFITIAAERREAIAEERPGAGMEVVSALLPFIPAMGMLAALFYRHATGGLTAERPLLWVVYPLVALFVLRQVMAVDELQRLSAKLETQVDERSRALAAAQEQLQRRRRLESLGRLAGGVAHDFNNLLAGISGYAHLIARKAPAGTPALTHVADINRAIERGAGLTRQILTFARRQPGEPQVVDPAQIVTDLQRLLASTLGDGVVLDIEAPLKSGHVRIDPGQLEQVIVNLVENARDAMPGGGRLLLRIGAAEVDAALAAAHDSAPGHYLTIEVTDDGVGMTPEIQARLFEPFFTTKPGGQRAGLGLAASYGIVRQVGGFFTVESAPDSGSTFIVHLPASAPAAPAETSTPAPRVATAARGRCVLLIDDSPALRTSLAAALRDHDYQVLSAENGEAGVELARAHQGVIDVLVTDMHMTGMTGIETARAIRALRPDIRSILISGFTDVPEEELPRDLPFLAKPFAPPQLVQMIQQVLRARSA